MIPVVVLGAGGHGRDVAHVARRAGFWVHGFLDDRQTGPEILGPFEKWESLGVFGLIGLNNSQARAKADSGLPSPMVIDPSVAGAPDCRLGPGVVIGAQVGLGPSVTLGKHTHIGAGSTITRASLGDFVTVAPGVTICGDVLVGDRVQIGAGAVIANMVKIGSDAVIGAGAVVLGDVPSGMTVVGVPARPIARRGAVA